MSTPKQVLDKNKVRALLAERDLTQARLALDIGVSPPRFSDWLNGHIEPGGAKLIRLAQELGVRLDQIVVSY